MGVGFLPQAFATALAASGIPKITAISLYDLVVPIGILSISSQTNL